MIDLGLGKFSRIQSVLKFSCWTSKVWYLEFIRNQFIKENQGFYLMIWQRSFYWSRFCKMRWKVKFAHLGKQWRLFRGPKGRRYCFSTKRLRLWPMCDQVWPIWETCFNRNLDTFCSNRGPLLPQIMRRFYLRNFELNHWCKGVMRSLFNHYQPNHPFVGRKYRKTSLNQFALVTWTIWSVSL